MKPLHSKAMAWLRPATRRTPQLPKTVAISNDREVEEPVAGEPSGGVEPATPPTPYSLVGW
jgi:hypothetical protein